MNGGDSVSWAKKPAIPESRQRAAYKKIVERQSRKKICPKCALNGVRSSLQLFQINDEESVLMCNNEECVFMPSSNWESLVVKREISRVSARTQKRRPFSLSTSSLPSTFKSSREGTTSRSAPQLSRRLKAVPGRRPDSPSTCISGHLVSSVHSAKSPAFRAVVSPTPSQDSEPADEERKTLVPLAPFLCGHAHTFSSFETKRIEDQRLAQLQGSETENQTAVATNKSVTSNLPGRVSRESSSDSDSFSRGSSPFNSRPPSPEDNRSDPPKKVRRLVVQPDVLSKILKGSLKVKIIKHSNSPRATVELAQNLHSATVTNKDCHESNDASTQYHCSSSHECKSDIISDCSVNSSVNCYSAEPKLQSLKATPVGLYSEILHKPSSEIELSLSHNSLRDSAQRTTGSSHIDAINACLQSGDSSNLDKRLVFTEGSELSEFGDCRFGTGRENNLNSNNSFIPIDHWKEREKFNSVSVLDTQINSGLVQYSVESFLDL